MSYTSILVGDNRLTLKEFPEAIVNCIVTSPPYYGLRDYGHADQIGLEASLHSYIEELIKVFRECRRVLRDDGVLWLNLGDSYSSGGGIGQPHRDSNGNGIGVGVISRGRQGYSKSVGDFLRPSTTEMLPPKNLLGIPWRVAFALQADGWILRQDIIWHKPAPMPESVKDRCTKAHEYVFLFAKSSKYYWDPKEMEEPSVDEERVNLHKQDGGRDVRNRRSVWTIGYTPYKGSHYATMPTTLAELCIRATCPDGGTVLDPFGGAGTTGLVANKLGKNALLCELNKEYAEMAKNRILDSLTGSDVSVIDYATLCPF